LLIFLVGLSACGEAPVSATIMPSPPSLTSPPPTNTSVPSQTPAPTPTSTQTLTPTPSISDFKPVLKNTPLPTTEFVIDLDTAKYVVQLAKWSTDGTNGNDIAFMPDGKTIVIGVGLPGVQFWDFENGVYERVIQDDYYTKNFTRTSTRLAISRSGEYVFFAAAYQWVWNISTNERLSGDQPTNLVSFDDESISSLAVSPTEELLATIGWLDYESDIYLIRFPSLAIKGLYTLESKLTAITFSPDGQLLAAGSEDGSILIWHTDDLYPFLIDPKLETDQPITHLSFAPNGQLAVADSDNRVMLWDLSTNTSFGFADLPDRISDMRFSPNQQIFATASEDHHLRLWNGLTGELIAELSGPTQSIYKLIFSPDGRFIATQETSGTVRIWGVWPYYQP